MWITCARNKPFGRQRLNWIAFFCERIIRLFSLCNCFFHSRLLPYRATNICVLLLELLRSVRFMQCTTSAMWTSGIHQRNNLAAKCHTRNKKLGNSRKITSPFFENREWWLPPLDSPTVLPGPCMPIWPSMTSLTTRSTSDNRRNVLLVLASYYAMITTNSVVDARNLEILCHETEKSTLVAHTLSTRLCCVCTQWIHFSSL